MGSLDMGWGWRGRNLCLQESPTEVFSMTKEEAFLSCPWQYHRPLGNIILSADIRVCSTAETKPEAGCNKLAWALSTLLGNWWQRWTDTGSRWKELIRTLSTGCGDWLSSEKEKKGKEDFWFGPEGNRNSTIFLFNIEKGNQIGCVCWGGGRRKEG